MRPFPLPRMFLAFICWAAVAAPNTWAQAAAKRPMLPKGFTAEYDVKYVPDGDAAQTLDIYFPEKPAEKAATAPGLDPWRRLVGGKQSGDALSESTGAGLHRRQHRISLQPEGDVSRADPGLPGRHPLAARQCQEVQHRSGSHRRRRRFGRRPSRRARRDQRRQESLPADRRQRRPVGSRPGRLRYFRPRGFLDGRQAGRRGQERQERLQVEQRRSLFQADRRQARRGQGEVRRRQPGPLRQQGQPARS